MVRETDRTDSDFLTTVRALHCLKCEARPTLGDFTADWAQNLAALLRSQLLRLAVLEPFSRKERLKYMTFYILNGCNQAIALFNPEENVFPDGRKVRWGFGNHPAKDNRVSTGGYARAILIQIFILHMVRRS